MYTGAGAGSGRCDAFAGYLQKFVTNSADQQQLFDSVGESQAGSRMREYLQREDVLVSARERFRKRCRGDVITPDAFEEYIRSEPCESEARGYLKGLVSHFNRLEDYVLNPLDINCSRQIFLASTVIRNGSIRLLEGVLSIVAVNTEPAEGARSKPKIKLTANTA